MDQYLNNSENNNSNSETVRLKIRIEEGYAFILLRTILYVEAKGHYAIIHLINKKSIEAHHPINWFLKNLPEENFFHCHRSFIINCRSFKCFSGFVVQLRDKISVPLSRGKKDLLEDHLLHMS
jgi:two-component system, LytTR family, response regulator